MSDLPKDARLAIDWLLEPAAADRRKETYWRIALMQASDEIDRLRERVAELTMLLREVREGCVGTDPDWLGSDSQQSWCQDVDTAIGLPAMKESSPPTNTPERG